MNEVMQAILEDGQTRDTTAINAVTANVAAEFGPWASE